MTRIDLEKTVRRVGRRTLETVTTASFIARHPRERARLPKWHREKNVGTLDLRLPFWPYDAIDWIAGALPTRPRVFEYGGGGSTLWLEDRGAILTVTEHDREWHQALVGRLAPETVVLFRPPTTTGHISSAVVRGRYFDEYVAAIDDQPDGGLDLVIVDGRARVECVSQAMPKVKPGGLLLFDDANRARYRTAVKGLAGWERHAFAGLKPGMQIPGYTSVWKRPEFAEGAHRLA